MIEVRKVYAPDLPHQWIVWPSWAWWRWMQAHPDDPSIGYRDAEQVVSKQIVEPRREAA